MTFVFLLTRMLTVSFLVPVPCPRRAPDTPNFRRLGTGGRRQSYQPNRRQPRRERRAGKNRTPAPDSPLPRPPTILRCAASPSPPTNPHRRLLQPQRRRPSLPSGTPIGKAAAAWVFPPSPKLEREIRSMT